MEVLTDYNTRLEKELEERGELQELLDVFIWQQQQLLWHAIQKQKVTENCTRVLSLLALSMSCGKVSSDGMTSNSKWWLLVAEKAKISHSLTWLIHPWAKSD